MGEDGSVVTRCVALEGDRPNGSTVLLASGLAVAMAQGGLGSAVCRIGETGCPPDDCFCHCKGGPSCHYWSYWQRFPDGEWHYAPLGAGSSRVQSGTVEGWLWGGGPVDPASVPDPAWQFAEICAGGADGISADIPPPSSPLRQATASWGWFLLLCTGLGGVLLLPRPRPQ
jgi:hypothetical protein